MIEGKRRQRVVFHGHDLAAVTAGGIDGHLQYISLLEGDSSISLPSFYRMLFHSASAHNLHCDDGRLGRSALTVRQTYDQR